MKKRIIAMLVSLTMITGIISGCGNAPLQSDAKSNSAKENGAGLETNGDPGDDGFGHKLTQKELPDIHVDETGSEPKLTQKELPDIHSGDTDAEHKLTQKDLPVINPSADFNASLIEFIESGDNANKNYMVSPTSFRAAMAMTIAGADGDTRRELLDAMGFKSVDEVNEWYKSVSKSTEEFETWLKEAKKDFKANKKYYGESAKEPEGAFEMENSIWRNTDASGKLSKKYIKEVKNNFGATAENVAPDKITEKINSWINENTKGLIPTISNDLSYADLVLVNTIYLKTSWVQDFSEGATMPGDFKTFNGSTVKKDFMNQRNSFRYYEDANGKFVILPMNGGVNAVFALGNVEDVLGKLSQAKVEEVDVMLPKFETETSFSNNELIDFCKARGANLPFNEDADFSLMSDEMQLFITDIIQKTKIKVDEKGIEAAAATAVMMCEGATAFVPECKEFHANEPFKYMIVTDSENPELLFYGQVVE